jgi:hypothetical protein
MARFARCDVRRGAAVFVGSDETTVSRNQLYFDSFRRFLLQIGGANIGARIALWGRRLPLSLAAEKRACSFGRPGQRRAILDARTRVPDARSWQ